MLVKSSPQTETGVKRLERECTCYRDSFYVFVKYIFYTPVLYVVVSLGPVYTCMYTVLCYSSCIENIVSGLMDLIVST